MIRNLGDQAVLSAVVDQWLQFDMDASTPDLDPVLASIEYRARLVKATYYKVGQLSGELDRGSSGYCSQRLHMTRCLC
jgi:hypothetical protein